jgi:hypothetical protein
MGETNHKEIYINSTSYYVGTGTFALPTYLFATFLLMAKQIPGAPAPFPNREKSGEK